MNQPKGHGLIIEAPSPTDYVAGDGKLSGEVINPEGDWLPFVPTNEHQAPQFETNACASFGTLNAFEILHKFFFGEELNLSDRMLAKGSNTDPARGNTPQRVAEWFRKNWSALQEDWPTDGVQSVQEFYSNFPDLLYSKAEIVRDGNVWGYEAITNPTPLKLREALTKGVVCMSVALMKDENNLWYKPAGFRDSHWITLLKIKPNGNYLVLDSYPEYIKEIRADFIPEVAYRYALNEAAVDGILTSIANIIKKLLAYVQTIKEEPTNHVNLHTAAILSLDKNRSPNAPDELGCADTWNEIYKDTFKEYLYQGNRASTYHLYKALRSSPKFKEVSIPLPGDTVISPTGYGRNPSMPNGHVGIVMENGRIASNDSRDGLFKINYTIESWRSKYVTKGLYPCFFYRCV
jgi:hypothetical protein